MPNNVFVFEIGVGDVSLSWSQTRTLRDPLAHRSWRDGRGPKSESITDATAEVLHKKYKPFGDTHSTTGTHSDLRGWIGEREEETELVYLNARYHDPEIGRFISPDPFAALGQGLNRFSYSFNNPINFSDPSGLFTDETPGYMDGNGLGGGSINCSWGPNGTRCGGLDPINIYRAIRHGLDHFFTPPGPRPDGVPADRADCSMDAGGDCGAAVEEVDTSTVATPSSTQPDTSDPRPIPNRPHVDPPIISVDDLKPGDVLNTGEGGLAQVFQRFGDGYGHSALVWRRRGKHVTVLSSDEGGIYVKGNEYDYVGGRWWDVFRVDGVNSQLLTKHIASLQLNGGLLQYLDGNGCSQVVARGLNASLKRPAIEPVAYASPRNLGIVLGPPIGRVYLPLLKPRRQQR